MKKFFRTYRILVGKSGSKDGIEIEPPFNVDFSVAKNTKEAPNIHNIRIYGLSPKTRDAIGKPDQMCVLYAGYKEEDGAILLASGNIVDAYSYHERGEIITSIDVLDGWVALRDTVVSLGYAEGVKAKQIIKAIAAQMRVSLSLPDSLPDRTWNHGFAFYGAAHAALHKVCAGAGYEWSIQNQTLQVIGKRGKTTRMAVVLNAGSGLVGFPQRVQVGAKEKSESDKEKERVRSENQQRNGWRVTALLTPQINPGDPVKIESKDVQGVFRVENVKHAGEYNGERWFTELEVSDER